MKKLHVGSFSIAASKLPVTYWTLQYDQKNLNIIHNVYIFSFINVIFVILFLSFEYVKYTEK